MTKPSKDDWSAARLLWETDPAATLADVAARLGISKPAASQYAKRHGWSKLTPVTSREGLSQVAADVLAHINGRDDLLAEVSTTLDLSVGTRVRILNLQRIEWQRWREQFTVQVMAGDPVAARRGKAAAEALAIAQRGECICYGMTDFGGRSSDAPLVEETADVEDKPKTRLQLILETFAATGSVPAEYFYDPPARLAAPRETHAPGD